MNVTDVRMIQRGEQLGLAGEPREPFSVVRERFGKHFKRDLPMEFRVARPIDLAHAARTERGEHFIRTNFGSWPEWHVRAGRILLHVSSPRRETGATMF